MEHFLNEEAVQRSNVRVRAAGRLMTVMAGIALAVFVALCLLTGTGNARYMLIAAMTAAIVSGWIVIGLWLFALEPARAEARHLAGLKEAEKRVVEGRLFLTGDSFRIPGSVRVRKARLETENETLSLNINEKLTGNMPPAGSLVRVEIARKFIIALEVLQRGPDRTARPAVSRMKRISRAVRRFFLPAVLWAALAAMVTGFVFNQITDTAPANKIVIYADCEVQNAPETAEKLEKALNGTVRMVKIHPFSYALFDSVRLRQADLYLVPDSHLAEYREWFTAEDGIPFFDSGNGKAAAKNCFLYDPAETYRLYTGAESVHLDDGLARRAAELLLSINDTAKEETP